MAEFKFRSALVLDFGRAQFEVRPDDPEFQERLENSQNLWEESFRKLNANGAKVNSTLLRSTCEGIAESVESVLGEGAVAEIFADRSICFLGLVDVVAYIRNEVDGYWKQATTEYNAAIAVNREQRRAVKRLPKPTGDQV